MTSIPERCAIALLVSLALQCSKEQPSPTRAAPPSSSGAVAAGSTRFRVDSAGEVTFLIDAPLEKIKGRTTKLRGYLDVDPGDLRATKGTVEVDLDDLKTGTFDDPGKNKTQTEHVHNWLEIGTDVEAKRREENRWARFTIKTTASSTTNTIAAAVEREGDRVVPIEASGDLWVHGVTAPKTLKLEVVFSGPAQAPQRLHVRTTSPVAISLREHDVKPRDLTGKFLAGALEKVGQKIDDTVQVSLDAQATR